MPLSENERVVESFANLLTTAEAAQAIRVSKGTICRWRERGLLPAVTLPGGRMFRYREDELRKIIEQGQSDTVTAGSAQ